jgi:hypothetical protein
MPDRTNCISLVSNCPEIWTPQTNSLASLGYLFRILIRSRAANIETNRTQLALFDMQTRAFGSYLMISDTCPGPLLKRLPFDCPHVRSTTCCCVLRIAELDGGELDRGPLHGIGALRAAGNLQLVSARGGPGGANGSMIPEM